MKAKSGRGGSCLELMNTTNVSEILPQKCLHWKKLVQRSTLSSLQVDGVNAVGDFVEASSHHSLEAPALLMF